MIVTCWSVKGGSGTTVVAASLAVLLSRRLPEGVLCVDAGGDVPAVLGLPEPSGPGLAEWLDEPDADAAALRRLTVEAGPGFGLLPRGAADRSIGDGRRGSIVAGTGAGADRLLAAATFDVGGPGHGTVVVDAGPPSALAFDLAASSTVSLLVLRPCYLALRRAVAAPCRPSAVVLVEDGRRSLDDRDVEDVLDVPVCAVVPWDPAIARSVDAGLLGARLPRSLVTALRSAA